MGVETPNPDIWLLLIKGMGMLCLVLALLIMVLYVLKRFLSLKGNLHRPDAVQMLACHYLSPRQRVILMDVLGEKILIGVTPQQITRLGRIRGAGDVSSGSSGSAFGDILHRTVKSGSGDGGREQDHG